MVVILRRIMRNTLLMVILISFVPLVSLAQEQDSDQVTHTVQAGENLFRIALRYGVTMDAIADANGISDVRRIYSGQVLVIPGLTIPDDSDEVVNPLVAATPTTHIVQPGESLTVIANNYGTTVEQILEANNIANPNRIERGQSLNIWTTQSVDVETLNAEPDAVAAAEVPVESPAQNITYIIQPGESLSQIAQRFGVDWQVLAQMNGIFDASRIFSGQEIVIPATNASGGVIDMGIVSDPIVANAPQPTITQGKQIVIDLSDSRVYAFENGVLQRSVLVSTGRAATPTVTGNYRIYHRVRSQTMSGPGYSLPNVEWVLYFYQGYAIHGTYWHSNWGQPMSHGCVNLPNEEARWFYENFGEIGLPVLVQQ